MNPVPEPTHLDGLNRSVPQTRQDILGSSRGIPETVYIPEEASKRTLVLRFGTIGDFVSALSYCNTHVDYDLFFTKSVNDFVFNRKQDYHTLLKFAPISTSTRVHFGTLYQFLATVRHGGYSRILIYSQSSRGCKLWLVSLLLRLLGRIMFRGQLVVKKFFHGGQYFHMLNQESQIKTILNRLPSSARISIFFDGKESAKNMSPESICAVCETLLKALHRPVISVYGTSRLALPNEDVVSNLTGRTTTDDLIRIFDETDLAITCDSGPLHVFSARGIPCIAFMSARHELLNWTPLTSKNYYIFDDQIECLGCRKAVCPRSENLCVNSELTREKFRKLFE